MDMYQQQPQYYGVPWNNSMNMVQPQYAVNPQQYYYPPQQTVAQQPQPVVQQQAPAGYAPAYVPDTNTVQRTTTLPQPTFQPPAMPQNIPVGYNVMGNSNNNSKPPKNRKESIISKNRRERGKAWVIETQAIKLFNMTESIIFDMACGNMTDEDKIRIYSVFGGVPYYNRLIDDKKSVRANIIDLIAAPEARLENEVSMYLNAEISKIVNANEDSIE